MGITAENVAEQFEITCEQQDAFALESQRRAAAAIATGYFKSQIVPIKVKSRKGVTMFDADEHPKAETTMESLARPKPAFKRDGTVTAGNASGINDGAAAVVLMDAAMANRAGLQPLARLVSFGVAGVDPSIIGTGPIPAVQLALKRVGLSVADIDVIESNETFAAQACAAIR